MSDKPLPDIPTIDKGTYRHTKSGNCYGVVGVALHSETLEPLVIYKPLYSSDAEYFVRPYSMFFEDVTINDKTTKRFIKIGD